MNVRILTCSGLGQPRARTGLEGRPATPRDAVKINLQRVVSLAGFIGCVHDAMVSHPVKRLRRAAQRQTGALEKEIGFDIKVRHCPGEPLAIIRSALMSSGANHVSRLFTGSIRNALQMMLESSDQPIFGEAAQMQLPAISRADFLEYHFQFEPRRPGARRPRRAG
jgi:hypothetical protein